MEIIQETSYSIIARLTKKEKENLSCDKCNNKLSIPFYCCKESKNRFCEDCEIHPNKLIKTNNAIMNCGIKMEHTHSKISKVRVIKNARPPTSN